MSLVSEFITDEQARLRSPGSRAAYRSALTQMFAHTGVPVGKVTVDHLKAWAHHGAPAPAPATINRRITMARQFFKWAHRKGLVKTDPTVDLGAVAGVRHHTLRKRNWLSEQQVRQVLDSVDTEGLVGRRNHLLLALGFFTALRIHEICNLRWRDIDLQGRVIHTVGKGEKPATIGISGQLAVELEEWRRLCPGDVVLPRFRHQWEDGQRVLAVCWADALGKDGAYEVVRSTCANAGFPGVAPHDMRRTLLGILDQRGVPLTEIKGISRHSNLATLERYLEDNPARSVNRLQAFEL